MSVHGTLRTSGDVRVKSAMRAKVDVRDAAELWWFTSAAAMCDGDKGNFGGSKDPFAERGR